MSENKWEDICLEITLNDSAELAELLKSECRSAGKGDICKTAAWRISCVFLPRLALLAHKLDLEASTLCLTLQIFWAGSCLHQLPLSHIKQDPVHFSLDGVQARSAQPSFPALKAPSFSLLSPSWSRNQGWGPLPRPPWSGSFLLWVSRAHILFPHWNNSCCAAEAAVGKHCRAQTSSSPSNGNPYRSS